MEFEEVTLDEAFRKLEDGDVVYVEDELGRKVDAAVQNITDPVVDDTDTENQTYQLGVATKQLNLVYTNTGPKVVAVVQGGHSSWSTVVRFVNRTKQYAFGENIKPLVTEKSSSKSL